MGAKAELIGSGPGVSAPGSKSRQNHLKVGFSNSHLRKTLGAVRAVLAYIFHDHQNNHRFAVPSIKVLSGFNFTIIVYGKNTHPHSIIARMIGVTTTDGRGLSQKAVKFARFTEFRFCNNLNSLIG